MLERQEKQAAAHKSLQEAADALAAREEAANALSIDLAHAEEQQKTHAKENAILRDQIQTAEWELERMLGEQDAAVAALEATEAHWSEEAAGLKADCDEIRNAQRMTAMALEDAEKSCSR